MASEDTPPARGFPEAEYAARTERAQRLMAERELVAPLRARQPGDRDRIL